MEESLSLSEDTSARFFLALKAAAMTPPLFMACGERLSVCVGGEGG